MKRTHRHVSWIAAAVAALAGCEGNLTLQNYASTSVHILAPGETAEPENELAAGASREVSVEVGLVEFLAIKEGSQVGATACLVGGEGTESFDVAWDGAELTCDYPPEPDSAGGGTSGRAIRPQGLAALLMSGTLGR